MASRAGKERRQEGALPSALKNKFSGSEGNAVDFSPGSERSGATKEAGRRRVLEGFCPQEGCHLGEHSVLPKCRQTRPPFHALPGDEAPNPTALTRDGCGLAHLRRMLTLPVRCTPRASRATRPALHHVNYYTQAALQQREGAPPARCRHGPSPAVCLRTTHGGPVCSVRGFHPVGQVNAPASPG